MHQHTKQGKLLLLPPPPLVYSVTIYLCSTWYCCSGGWIHRCLPCPIWKTTRTFKPRNSKVPDDGTKIQLQKGNTSSFPAQKKSWYIKASKRYYGTQPMNDEAWNVVTSKWSPNTASLQVIVWFIGGRTTKVSPCGKLTCHFSRRMNIFVVWERPIFFSFISPFEVRRAAPIRYLLKQYIIVALLFGIQLPASANSGKEGVAKISSLFLSSMYYSYMLRTT